MTATRRAVETGVFSPNHARRDPIHTAFTVVMLLSLCLGAACRQPGPEAGEENESIPEAEAGELDSVDTSTRAPERVARAEPYVSAFAHDAHREIECSTCHDQVLGHRTHGDVSCTECHEVPQSFGSFRRLAEHECLECHHARQQRRTCGECHATVDSGRPRAVRTSIDLTTGTSSPSRDLPFRHEQHIEPSCETCHTRSVLATVDVTCGSCHERHHEPDADCGLCHPSVPAEPHSSDNTHAGCGGSGCHADPVINELPPSRSLCLVCHNDQRTHEPEGDCAACHGIRVWAGRVWPPTDGGPR